MYMPNYSSSAYQLDRYVEQKVDKKAEAEKRRQLKIKAASRKVAIGMAFVLLLRCVKVYDLHSEAAKKAAELENLRMKNEQTQLPIENMTDKAKIQDYAENVLGLQKMTDAQIVYLNPHKENYMSNVAKDNNSSSGGAKGFFAGFLEYLK